MCADTFDWPLHAGTNTPDAHAGNAFGKRGIVSTLEVNDAK